MRHVLSSFIPGSSGHSIKKCSLCMNKFVYDIIFTHSVYHEIYIVYIVYCKCRKHNYQQYCIVIYPRFNKRELHFYVQTIISIFILFRLHFKLTSSPSISSLFWIWIKCVTFSIIGHRHIEVINRTWLAVPHTTRNKLWHKLTFLRIKLKYIKERLLQGNVYNTMYWWILFNVKLLTLLLDHFYYDQFVQICHTTSNEMNYIYQDLDHWCYQQQIDQIEGNTSHVLQPESFY